ncbi:DUF6286 domain-containing protein [Streptomyces sp. PmtG]
MSAPPVPVPDGTRPRTPAGRRGTTTVADRAVRRVAERAATETPVPGAVRVSGGTAAVRGRGARVGVTVALPYPAALDDTARAVQRHVTARTAELTGLDVPLAEVRVRGLTRRAPGSDAAPPAFEHPPSAPEGTAARRAGRPWSQRRVPVALLALAAAAGCAVALYDVVAVRAAGQTPAVWRVRLVDWLAAHGPDGGTATALAACAVSALGVCLIVLAVTPGRRAWLPMASPDSGTRAAVERRAVAALVRDAVTAVPTVRRAAVRVGRRTARVRAEHDFSDRHDTREAVRRAVTGALDACGLAGRLRPRVRLRSGPEVWEAEAVGAVAPGIRSPGHRLHGGRRPGEHRPESPGPGTRRDRRGAAMSRVRGSTNRAALLALGVLAVGGGAALATTTGPVRRRLPDAWPRLGTDRVWLDASDLGRWRDQAWWPAAVIAVLCLGTLLLLAWAAYEIRPGRLRRLPLGHAAVTLSGSALAAAVADRAESVPGVERAQVRLLGRPRRLRVLLTVTLAPGAAPAATLTRLTHAAVDEARAAVAPRALDAEIRLTTRSRPPRRPRSVPLRRRHVSPSEHPPRTLR